MNVAGGANETYRIRARLRTRRDVRADVRARPQTRGDSAGRAISACGADPRSQSPVSSLSGWRRHRRMPPSQGRTGGSCSPRTARRPMAAPTSSSTRSLRTAAPCGGSPTTPRSRLVKAATKAGRNAAKAARAAASRAGRRPRSSKAGSRCWRRRVAKAVAAKPEHQSRSTTSNLPCRPTGARSRSSATGPGRVAPTARSG